MDNLPTRNNNPGDLRDPSTGAFRKFANPTEGKAALYNDLTTKMTGKSGTGLTPKSSILDFAKTYAPASDDNDPVQYAANLSNQLKVSPDAPIGSLMPRIDDFAKAIAQNEGFQESETPEAQPQKTATGMTPDMRIGHTSGINELETNQTTQPLANSEGSYSGKPVITPAESALAFSPLLAFAPALALELGAGTSAAVGGAAAAGEAAAPGLISRLGSGALKLLGIESAGEAAITGAKKLFGATDPTAPSTQPGLVSPPMKTFEQSLQEPVQQSNAASRAIIDSMRATATGRVAMQDPLLQQAAHAMGAYGLVPDIGEDGSMDFTAADKKRRSALQDLSENAAKMLDADNETGDIDQAVQLAKASVRKYAPSHEWEEADSHIDKAATTYKKNFGNGKSIISLGNMERMKKELGHGQKWGITDTSAKKSAYKALSAGARSVVENTTKHKALYNSVMKEEQRLIKAREIMKRLSGKKAKQNVRFGRRLSQFGAKTISTYIGDKMGGAIGAVLGNIVGEYLGEAIDKRHGKTIFETKPMRRALELLKDKSPQTFTKLMEQLKEAGAKIEVPNDQLPPLIPTKYLKKRDERLRKEKAKGARILRQSGLPPKLAKKRDERLARELKRGEKLIASKRKSQK